MEGSSEGEGAPPIKSTVREGVERSPLPMREDVVEGSSEWEEAPPTKSTVREGVECSPTPQEHNFYIKLGYPDLLIVLSCTSDNSIQIPFLKCLNLMIHNHLFSVFTEDKNG